MSETLYSKKDLAKLLRISTRSIDLKIHAGEFPSGFLLGRLRRWRKSQIDAYLNDLAPTEEQPGA